MKKNNIIYFIAILVVIILGTIIIYYINNQHIDNKENLINTSEYSDVFMNNYFDEISKHNSDEEKENMLIVISNSKIENTYGAKNIIEAPNKQFILQYETTEKKNEALSKLKEDSSISSVEENIIYKTCDTEYNSWGIEKMSLDHAIESSRIELLSDITVAIIDTGCDTRLFYKYYSGKMQETYNVLENSTTSTSMVDEDGHGTHIAGTIAEATPQNVNILPVKVSRDGRMFDTDIIAAINYITYNEKADVINMSFGGYSYSEAIEDAINVANNKNIICVAAAGNEHTNKNHYPSALENTISIASVNSNLTKSAFSNYGASITFTAPGTNIKSIMGRDTNIVRDNIRGGYDDGDNDHETISGTSMSTPHAVSAVAILKSYNKNLALNDVIELLKNTAVDLGEEGWDEYFGYGLISFNGVEFRDDNINKDEYGVYKNINKNITNIELAELKFTPYNYYSLTNIMGSRINVYYKDNSFEEMLLWELPNLEVLNYIPTEENEQEITIKTGNISTTIDVTNPINYESGWEYSLINQSEIIITGYKSHNSNIGKLYIPEKIDSKNVKAFDDNLKLNELSSDFSYYDYLYLPSKFSRIGNYAFSNTSIKYVYGDSTEIEVGNHAFESSSIVIVDVPITDVGDCAFKDCLELINVDIPGRFAYTSVSNDKISNTSIGNYAFYNCKKLNQIEQSKDYDIVYAKKIGKYAFYNCILLAKIEIEPFCDIEEYAFYNCFKLNTINLHNVDSIGIYSFYGSGISEVQLGSIEEIKESSFENCMRLKAVSCTSGNIETRAFWNSALEEVTIGSKVNYIAEDAFAYCPIKNCDGGSTSGNYHCMENDGIIENATNKLIVGFKGSLVSGITQIPNSVTEIGNYAFTGNNTVKTIIIPENVTKIGDYAFKDCYQLSSVYMLGNNIEFGNDTFVRTYESEIQNSELFIYLHKDNSNIRQYIKSKNLEYRNIEPDEIVVIDNKKVYSAFEKVDEDSLIVKLIYYEENDREEILSKMNFNLRPILTNSGGVGFQVSSGSLRYGDTYYTLQIINIHGYEEKQKKVEVEVIKAIPRFTVPTNLTGVFGQKLSEIVLPNGFEWMNGNEIIDELGEKTFKARYVPVDTINYETVENIDISIKIGKAIPKYTVPINLTGNIGQKLSEIVLPEGFEWIDSNQIINQSGNVTYKARYIPADTINYEIVDNIDIPIDVNENIIDNTSVMYKTHVQNDGWQNWKKDGQMAGTQGRSLRLEGINIKLENQVIDGNITYSTHIQNIGWQDWKVNGEMSGTEGQSLRLEAIKIKLEGNITQYYDIYYRVHAQNFGWLGWAKNGEPAGTAGYAYRLEGIEIVLNSKDKPFLENTSNCFKQNIQYKTHVQNVGWQNYVNSGEMSGTTGQSLRLEGIIISLNNTDVSGSIEYRTHVQNIGWQGFVSNNQMSGTSGQSLRLEAIQIKLTGGLAEKYDIYYRVHCQNFGWLGWAKNGESAGSEGYAYRLEGIEIKLVDKNENVPLNGVSFYINK